MLEEKQAKGDGVIITPPHSKVEDYHTKNFQTVIENFCSFANASHFIEVNNDLLHSYLRSGWKENDDNHKQINEIVFMISTQNQFIAALNETWEMYKSVVNLNK